MRAVERTAGRRRQPYREVEQACCDVGALEEALGVLVDFRRSPLADVIQVDGELGGVERLAFAEVLAKTPEVKVPSCALSTKTPEGAPEAPRMMRPPEGSGVDAVTLASCIALAFASSA